MELPNELRYSAEHEWVRVDGARTQVGITDFAQDALGDIVYVQLPEVGSTVSAAGPCCEIESTKAVSDVYAPVSGTIVEINGALADAPEQVNADPYGTGWLFVIEMTDLSELDTLMDAAAYRALVDEE
jgi:glycine cleavage system H protein